VQSTTNSAATTNRSGIDCQDLRADAVSETQWPLPSYERCAKSEVLPFLVEKANELGLTVFDWDGPSIYRPST
jgi:hypothetical protein